MQRSTCLRWLTTANRETRLGHAVLWSMLGCGALLFAPFASSNLMFWWDGQSVQGVVTSAPAKALHPPKFGPKYVVRYEYSDAGGNVHWGEDGVRSATNYRPGDPIAVRYLRTDAARSRLPANVRIMPPLFIACLGLVIVVMSGWHGIGGICLVNEKVLARPRVGEAGSGVV